MKRILTVLLLGFTLSAFAATEDIVFEDFEGKTYGEWKVEGEAFGKGPTRGGLKNHRAVKGRLGKGMVNTFLDMDRSTGTLTSPEFTIERRYISFLIGGGPSKATAIRLLVNGKQIMTQSGLGSEAMDIGMFDVKDYKGKKAQLKIVDHNKGGWGHVLVDQILMTDIKPPSAAVMKARKIKITGKYLLVPIYKKAAKNSGGGQLEVFVGDRLMHRMDLHIAEKADDVGWWASVSMDECVGKTATLKYPVNDVSKALELIESSDEHRNMQPLYDESLRPQLRFSQARGWNNDPNGMVYYDGEYHLFWQCNPVGTYWDNMYWGHAVSKDLIHWEERPLGMRVYGKDNTDRHPSMAKGRCHSGGACVDFNNTLGFQKGDTKTLIATFTDTMSGEAVSYSTDKGKTWNYYHEINPIIKHGGRDPKPFWYEPSKHWVIAVFDGAKERGGQNISFYVSKDFKKWEYTSHNTNYFECPEFVELPVDGDEDNKKWVLLGANAQYQIGDFDGRKFTPDHEVKKESIVGRIFSAIYAGQCFSDAPDGRAIFIAWAGMAGLGKDHDHDNPFQNGFTLPIELSLKATPDGIRLFAEPVKEFDMLRDGVLFDGEKGKTSFKTDGQEFDIVLKVKSPKKDGVASLKIGETVIPIDLTQDDPKWRFVPNKGKVGMAVIRVIVDRPFMEVVSGNGRRYQQINRTDRGKGVGEISLTTTQGEIEIEEFKIYKVKSIWR